MVPLVDTAIFISLPQAPTAKQWEAIRSAVGRRVVNAWVSSNLLTLSLLLSHLSLHYVPTDAME